MPNRQKGCNGFVVGSRKPTGNSIFNVCSVTELCNMIVLGCTLHHLSCNARSLKCNQKIVSNNEIVPRINVREQIEQCGRKIESNRCLSENITLLLKTCFKPLNSQSSD